MVQWLKQDPENRVIVCHSEYNADCIRKDYGLTREQTMSYERASWDSSKAYVVDNADLILQKVLWLKTGNVPAYITTNLEEVNPREYLD